MMKNLVDKTMFKFRTPVCSSLPLRASPEGIQFTSGNQQCQSLDMTTSDHMKSMAVLLLTYEIYWKMLMGSRVNWTRPRILWRKKSPSMSHFIISSVQFSSVAQRCCSEMSDSLRPHGLQHARPPCPLPTPQLAQIHVHRVGDSIQPSNPLLSPSPPAFNLSQGLFKWVNSLHQVAKVLEFQFQHQIFQWISDWSI